MKQLKIGKKTIGNSFPALVVAEMAWSHDGSVENARKIIKAASDAKADAIKFHITSLEGYSLIRVLGDPTWPPSINF